MHLLGSGLWQILETVCPRARRCASSIWGNVYPDRVSIDYCRSWRCGRIKPVEIANQYDSGYQPPLLPNSDSEGAHSTAVSFVEFYDMPARTDRSKIGHQPRSGQ